MGEFWNAASHTDGVVLNPTLIFDGQIFEKDGMFVDEKAIEFCKKLGVAGY
jgi:leucyl aminopeptidase (aminopeptidase T)